MKLWLIRHAEAVDAEKFFGGDLERPLTPAGRKSAQAAFTRLASLRRGPDVVISSCAVRALETARIFGLAFGIQKIEQTEGLNPGCRFKDIRNVVRKLPKRIQFAALVGHEPDFSEAISRWTSDGQLGLILKKGGLVELEWNKGGTADLVMAIPPDILGGLG
jgi:phosphohistidine phosphatase